MFKVDKEGSDKRNGIKLASTIDYVHVFLGAILGTIVGIILTVLISRRKQ